ncbi:LysM peptidoglycan-binding domain-containing protein [Flavobacterium restrictum]|uniref:LysM peptidoglycan-binding domain-containing protein n=1 Tax=Flavobacterium restrictum TaxID=2594428 RepID=A0A553DTD6_9FLAO|nr:LysM peptidoglycan-binding domain-containing protein [Flavobacterium restrictum]TRX35953.1 LysM peptidoglycan-binding domain-containing protein [Flavobacterium restrictum]
MTIKNTTLSFFLLATSLVFSQQAVENKEIAQPEIKISYLDSIKKTFKRDDIASCVDSLWMKELTNLDLFNDLSTDIQTINTDQKVDFELPTELLKERLAAMDAKSPFNIEYNQGLENLIKSFLKNRKKAFGRLMATSEYYFPIFEEALAKQNVPLEIKYLAVVESALNPKAVSRVGATGLWQFMYQTGKQYKLNIDSYVDDRSDPLKSSEAAAQYMTNMYAIFGDWDLVLASYNSGPGNVAKAIRRSGGQQNFWNIKKHLPQETQGYVPAFLATMYIYEYHKEHGIVPERALVKNFATDTIRIKKQMSFKQIADLIDIPVVELQLLNPSYKLNVIPFYGDQDHYLRLPQDKIAIFTSNEDKIYAYAQHELDRREKPFQIIKAIALRDTANYTTQRITLPKTKYYKVKRGDNLTTIANKYDVSVADLKNWNNLKGNTVAHGKSLKIITNESVVRSVKKTPALAESKKEALAEVKINKEEATKKTIKKDSVPANTPLFYVVQKGDNLSAIAKKNNITVAEIKEWNHLSTANVQLGASLQIAQNGIEVKEETVPAPILKDIQYVVQKGDNLGNIAKKFGATVQDLKQWNTITTTNIALGSTLVVAKNEIAITTNNATASTFKKKETGNTPKDNADYYVKKGDSLYSISKKYPGVTISDLKKWNDIGENELKPGMKLKING